MTGKPDDRKPDDRKIRMTGRSGHRKIGLPENPPAFPIDYVFAIEGQQFDARGGLTPDQRFFIGMAQWACGDERPESKRLHAITDPHSPNEYRINGVVANLPQFGAAFGCKPGQPMMRVNSCRVW